MPAVLRTALHGLKRQFLRFADLFLLQKRPDLLHSLVRIRIVPGSQSPGPYGILIELEVLRLHAAEHHGAHASVAHRQSLVKIFRRLCIPKQCFLSHRFLLIRIINLLYHTF